ncbi:MAG TPA: radical SAM protein, partial [Elusimicrobiota bacterium]|nr:radical SAM protein [Elusimicrobiota bacterium]
FLDFERVEAEMSAIMNSNIKRVWLADAVANLDKERFKKILRLLLEKNANKVLFDFEMVAEMLDDETVELLAGLPGGYMACGLQSTDPTALKNSKRFSNLARFRRNIETLRRLNGKIEIWIDVIYGLPGDTWATYRNSVDFALSFFPDKLQVHRLRALPGTQFHSDAARLGLVHDERPPYFARRTPTFSPADFRRASRLAWVTELYNVLPPVRVAVSLAGRSGGGVLAALETLAAPLGPAPRRASLGQVSEAVDRFLEEQHERLPKGAAGVLKEFNRYAIGLMTNAFPRRAIGRGGRDGFSLQIHRLSRDYERLMSDRGLLSPDLDWRGLPKKKTMVAFNEGALHATFAQFAARRDSYRPIEPHGVF